MRNSLRCLLIDFIALSFTPILFISALCMWLSPLFPCKATYYSSVTHLGIKCKGKTLTSYYPLECFRCKKKIYLHLHPPSGLWPLSNTWLFGESSSLKLFGQLPYPMGKHCAIIQGAHSHRKVLTYHSVTCTHQPLVTLTNLGSLLSPEIHNSCPNWNCWAMPEIWRKGLRTKRYREGRSPQ